MIGPCFVDADVFVYTRSLHRPRRRPKRAAFTA